MYTQLNVRQHTPIDLSRLNNNLYHKQETASDYHLTKYIKMENILKKVKDAFTRFWNSTVVKVVKVVTIVAVGLFAMSGLMQVLTYTIISYKSLTKAIAK